MAVARLQEPMVSTESGLESTPFDPAALDLAVEALGEALGALDAHERETRQASRAALREKARTGRLKPLRGLTTGPVVDAKQLEASIAAWDFEELEDAAAAAAAALRPSAATPEKEPA